MEAKVNNELTTTEPPLPKTDSSPGHLGPKCILLVANLRPSLQILKHTKKTFSLHGSKRPNYCSVTAQRNNLIKLPHYHETKKSDHDSQIARAK